jgi:N-terminal acetyltransferase B complex catalytic subunit
VDLFVRPSNQVAVGMYEGLGYSVYRKVAEYYQGGGKGGQDEDGYGKCCWKLLFLCSVLIFAASEFPTDMRKAMPRDTKKETVRDGKLGRNTVVRPE